MTKIIKAMLSLAFVLSVGVATPLMASELAGPYIAIQGQVNGIELDGSSTDSNSETHKGKGGIFGMAAGIDVGYSVPMGDNFLLGIGAVYNPASAQIELDSGNSNTSSAADVTLEVKDIYTLYIQPTIAVSDSSAVFAKWGYTEAGLEVTGDATKIDQMTGETYAIGTQSVFPSGFYLQTEAGVIDYDNISMSGLGTWIAVTNSVTADPTIAYGAVTLGMKF